MITKVRLKLNKNPTINTSYFETGKSYKKNVSLENELVEISQKPYTIQDVYKAVINIRNKKFPDISKKGTAGSFFKNPIVDSSKLKKLLKEIPDLQYYPANNLVYKKLDSKDLTNKKYIKIPVAKLLDVLGWKGKRFGNAGVHEHQAVVVVNHGNASGDDILKLSKRMQSDVYKHFKIRLEPEVKIIN